MKPLARAPLAAHAVALLVVLILTMLFVRPFAAYSTDEGVGILQARHLEATGDWLIPQPPISSLDEELKGVPYAGDQASKGKAYYAKHPLYPVLLRAVDHIGDRAGFFLLSMFGTFFAAVGTALVARQLRTSLGVPALWLTGVGSTLFFYANVVVAHSVAAASAAMATVLVLRLRREGNLVLGCLVLSVAIGFCVSLRGEAMFVGPALALGLLAANGKAFLKCRRDLVISSVLVGSTVIVRGVETVIVSGILGTYSPALPGNDGQSFLIGRLMAMNKTIFTATGDAYPVLLIAVLVLFIVSRVLRDPRARLTGWCIAAALYAVVFLTGEYSTLDGLAVAMPVAWYAIAGVRRSDVPADASDRFVFVFLAAAFGAYFLMVAATQYVVGGGGEWGGRFFALGLPWLVPLAALIFRNHLREMPHKVAVSTLVVAVFVSGVTAAEAAHKLRATHLYASEAETAIEALVEQNPQHTVLFTGFLSPQIMWDGVDAERWLVAEQERGVQAIAALAERGDARVLVVTSNPSSELPEFEKQYELVARHGAGSGFDVLEGVHK